MRFALGGLAIVFYLAQAAWHLAHGTGWDLFWVCNVSLPILVAGCFLENGRLCAITFMILTYGTPMWALDLCTGGSMVPTSPLVHVASPIVAAIGARKWGWPKHTWMRACGVTLALLVVTRLVTPAPLNVNLAFRVHDGWERYFPSHLVYVATMWAGSAAAFFVVELVSRRVLVSRAAIATVGILLVGCEGEPRTLQRRAPRPPLTVAPSAPPMPAEATSKPAPARAASLYWAGWAMTSDIKLDGATDVVLFSLVPTRSGVDALTNGLTDERIARARDAARAIGARTYVAVGGVATSEAFLRTTDAFAEALAEFVEERELDGLILDIEPLAPFGAPRLAGLVRALHERVGFVGVAVAPDPRDLAVLAGVQPIDRVDVMTYERGTMTDEAITAALPNHRVALGVRLGSPCASSAFVWEAGAVCRGRPTPCAPLAVACR